MPDRPLKPGERYGSRALNEREEYIIELVAAGLKNREAAHLMGLSEHTLKNYLRVIYDKLGMDNRVQLALWWEAHRGPYRLEVMAAAQVQARARNAKAAHSAA
jgi:DNA-binding NarL/FixJ family response regulator